MTFKQTHFPIFFEAPSLSFPFFKPIRKLFPSSLTFITPAPRNRSSANLFLSSFGVGAEGRGWWRGRGGRPCVFELSFLASFPRIYIRELSITFRSPAIAFATFRKLCNLQRHRWHSVVSSCEQWLACNYGRD